MVLKVRNLKMKLKLRDAEVRPQIAKQLTKYKRNRVPKNFKTDGKVMIQRSRVVYNTGNQHRIHILQNLHYQLKNKI